MTDNPLHDIQRRVNSFAEDMRSKGIHVGMGANPRCVTCGEAWPCAASRQGEETP